LVIEFAPSREVKAAFLILLFLSSGFLLPISSAIQNYEINKSSGGNFYVDFQTGDSQNQAPQGGVPVSLLQSVPAEPSQKMGDFFYIRDGNNFIFIPQLSPENGSPTLAIPFSPLLVWLDSERRRSRFRIYVEILELLKNRSMSTFEISFLLRLNSKRTKEYIDFLAAKGFLESSVTDGKNVCTVTEEGKKYVESIRTVMEKE
jgi:predicted transcriptional regulator